MGRKKSGFHGFRRYRINHLRNERVTEVLLRIWVGQATHGITDHYTVDALNDLETKLPVAPRALKLHPDEFAASA